LTNIFTNVGTVYKVLLEGEYVFGIYGLNSSSNFFVDFVLDQYKIDCDDHWHTFEPMGRRP
jgi:hypothetical protein